VIAAVQGIAPRPDANWWPRAIWRWGGRGGVSRRGVKIGLFLQTPMFALTRAIAASALQMLLTGELWRAHAAEWGLINQVVPGRRPRAASRTYGGADSTSRVADGRIGSRLFIPDRFGSAEGRRVFEGGHDDETRWPPRAGRIGAFWVSGSLREWEVG